MTPAEPPRGRQNAPAASRKLHKPEKLLQEGHRDLYDFEINRIYNKIKNIYPYIIM